MLPLQKSINNGDLSFSEVVKVPYSELIGEEIPDGCDSSQKEVNPNDVNLSDLYKPYLTYIYVNFNIKLNRNI